MKRLLLILVLFVIFACDTSRNTPNPSEHFFIRYYGTDGDQEGVDMVANADETFTLLGTSQLTEIGDKQIYLTKVNQDGIVLWERFYGTANNETAKDIEPTVDGGYVILADQENSGSGTDIYLLTIDANGNQTNVGSFTYPSSVQPSHEIGVSVTELLDANSNSGYIVAGHTDYDSIGFVNTTALFVRFKPDLTLFGDDWTNSGGYQDDDFCTKIVQVGDLNGLEPFLFFGYTNSNVDNTSFNYWASVLTSGGGGGGLDELGNGILPGSPSGTIAEKLGSVTTTYRSSGINKFLMAGILSDGSGNDKIYLAELNSNGSLNLGFTTKTLDINIGDITSFDPELLPRLQKITAYPSRDLGYVIAAIVLPPEILKWC